jgi:glutamine amidotransferase
LIRILDYGLGNLRSVEKAVERLGGQVSVETTLANCDKLIIPGVGAFGAAMERLGPIAEEIRRFAESGKPVLGICLGQQLLFDSSEELGNYDGLGLIPGAVKYLPKSSGLKIPHMGWSPISVLRREGIGTAAETGDQVYFVHSLYTECANRENVVATANYGVEFPAAVQLRNVWGVQFHPEKSSDVGLRMLKACLEC